MSETKENTDEGTKGDSQKETEQISSIYDKAQQIVEQYGEPSTWEERYPSRVAYLDVPDSQDLRGHNRVLVWAGPESSQVVIDYSKNISNGKYLNTTVRLERTRVVSFNAPVEEWHGDSPIFRQPWRPGIKPAPIARYEHGEFGHDILNLDEVQRMLNTGIPTTAGGKTIGPSKKGQGSPTLLGRILRRQK